MKEELKQEADFANANTDSNIVSLLNIVNKVCLGGNFGNTHDTIYWTLTQYQKLFNYTQIPQKDTGLWLKSLNGIYNNQVSNTRSLVCGQMIMEEVFAKKVGPGISIAHYFNQVNEGSVPT